MKPTARERDEMGPHRGEVCKIISEMLDNPDEYGIYPTSVAFQQFDALILAAERAAAERMRERCAQAIRSCFSGRAIACSTMMDGARVVAAINEAEAAVRALPLEDPDDG